ncbi:hypothetical protein [Listeria booriae]|uniref:Uncharacterized protein n=1 Tax=Listeria booriae TaxID=1552123 RepID=A0A7X1DKU1_9LIST|nr:hypothetical protein [Listeria booriae]MBC1401441.1 hypothetical protein [Listeria booriae]MBC1615487.1 hypothetical protein [Listeria booriae]MBC1919066.1 hypothetical protein [Listeria booriae]MBC2284711.1 hypothetical protein [Listeria booriae]MBC2294264.1 hypothetical protein [Listeria booriae]
MILDQDVDFLTIILEELNAEMAENNVYADVILIGGLLGKYLLKDEFRETIDISMTIYKYMVFK